MRNAICFSNFRDGAFSWPATVQNIKDMARLDPRMWVVLRVMMTELASRSAAFRVTAAKKSGGSGVHDTDPLRAIDVGCQGLADDVCREIEAAINAEFPRNDGKPTCLYHDSGEGRHFHLQLSWDFPSSSYSDPGVAGALS